MMARGTAGPSDVFDPYVRTISNLIVDQTLGNPSAILTGLQRAGIVAPADQMTVTAQISAAYEPLADEFKAVQDAARGECRSAGGGFGQPGQCGSSSRGCSHRVGPRGRTRRLWTRSMMASWRCSTPTASSSTAPTS